MRSEVRVLSRLPDIERAVATRCLGPGDGTTRPARIAHPVAVQHAEPCRTLKIVSKCVRVYMWRCAGSRSHPENPRPPPALTLSCHLPLIHSKSIPGSRGA